MLNLKMVKVIIDTIVDNMYNCRETLEKRIYRFKIWHNLSWIGGIFETNIYDESREYGISKIKAMDDYD